MYIKNMCTINDKIEIEKHYSGNYGAPGQKREAKRERTPEEMARQNFWRRIRHIRRVIELNFKPADYFVTLTCRKEERPAKEDAPKVIRTFRDAMRREYKKQGWELKYIITCEVGQRGAVHWHMIVNNCSNKRTDTGKLIWKLWTRGRPWFELLDSSGDYSKLAEYIVKESKSTMEKERTVEKLSYMASRNLKKPVIRTVKVDARGWKKEPRAPKGWEVVPESIVNGFNTFTGLPYQHYTIRKRKGGGG